MLKTIMVRHFLLAILTFSIITVISAMPESAVAQEDNSFGIEDTVVDQPLPQDDTEVSAAEQSQKFEVANEILALNPLDRTLASTIDNLAQSVPANRRILFKSIMNRSIKIDRLNTAAQLAFAEIFTLNELTAMRDFYASEEGAAINEKMPEFENRIQPVIEAMVQDAIYNIRNSNVDFSQ